MNNRCLCDQLVRRGRYVGACGGPLSRSSRSLVEGARARRTSLSQGLVELGWPASWSVWLGRGGGSGFLSCGNDVVRRWNPGVPRCASPTPPPALRPHPHRDRDRNIRRTSSLSPRRSRMHPRTRTRPRHAASRRRFPPPSFPFSMSLPPFSLPLLASASASDTRLAHPTPGPAPTGHNQEKRSRCSCDPLFLSHACWLRLSIAR